MLFSPKTASKSPEVWNTSDLYVIAHNSPILNPGSDIEAIIISKAIANGISPELFLKIAKCESNLRIDAHNSRSSASGIFQWLDSSIIHYANAYGMSVLDKNDPILQAELAAKVIADGGLHNWNASRSCWE